MNKFSENPEIQNLILLRRARQLASAIIKRSREAGIPDRYMRINQQRFSSVLNSEFHGKAAGVKLLANSIYNDPDFLLKRSFIAIDGGNPDARDFAGYAILFRMIAYDKIGKSWNCGSLGHKFQTINSTNDITRNDLADELKEYDVLFLNELRKKDFSPHFESGSFFDEVLADRVHTVKPTIVTFSSPIESEEMSESKMERMAADGKLDSGYGERLAYVSWTPKTTESVLRVRVNIL